MLSKSRFVAGLQCPLRLWNQSYRPELATEPSLSRQAIFDMGHEVGRLATRLYPGGVRIEEDHLHHEEAVRSTAQVLSNRGVPALFEAAFVCDRVRVRVDILERLPGEKWDLVEVKSATSVKGVYLPDLAVQCHVLQGSGIGVRRAGILHVNNQYVYDGCRLDLEELFRLSDLTEEVIAYQDQLPARLSEFHEMLADTSPPQVAPSRHCASPYRCEFWEHCTQETAEFWVLQLPGISQKRLDELKARGIEDIREIPDAFPLSELQARVRECVQSQSEFASPGLARALSDVDYPVHFLDFETIGPAIPRYAGTRPYQTIPFQWSDHVLHEKGTLAHREFLYERDGDPRDEFCVSLLEALGDRGTILIYTSYEADVIRRLAEDLPGHAEKLLAILDRCRDLCEVIRRCYYHPGFRGSFSLKAVLPAIVPSMKYESLAIQEGSQASLEYLRMMDPATPSDDRDRIRSNLLAYCSHDTLAMVRIREELLRRF